MKQWIMKLLGLGRIKTELEQSVRDFAEFKQTIEELEILNRKIYDKLEEMEQIMKEGMQ